ncbi:MAG TPA: Gfo/Idh/MocA family oxidoreductase, partial [Gemmatimonadales bacterium]|nr:Gfo/Idh/MocA family oxidoreductase [Gemmatimonadales bacterium]
MSARLPVGVVGTGALGRHHARHLATLEGVELVGIADADPATGERVAAEVGTRHFPDLDDLLGRVEAVSVAVPTSVHHAVGRRALERGVAVLMEKPLTASLEEADDLVALAESEGLPLAVGHIERFNRAVRAALPLLDGPRFAEAERVAPFTPRGTDVPVVLDLMIHDLDLVLHLFGGREATDVRAVGVPLLSPHVDIANAWVEFGGAVANVTTSRLGLKRERRLRLVQPSGYFSLDLAAGTGMYFRLREGWTPGGGASLEEAVEMVPLEAPEGDALRMELDDFARAVRGGGAV